RVGGGVTAPVLVTEILPEYSEEARKARFQGTVVLNTIVHEDGSVQVIKVLRGIGFGLDQNAIAAVLQWRFKPARRNGKPVASYLNVEVSFNLR
ncbi:MAG TPA: energy transducer TonB, partial [Terriglobia bacterium]|nr:energy transducer TonB [Terriglobia bacterium]